MMQIRQSGVRAYRRCPRLYSLAYEQSLVPAFEIEDARSFGSAAHKCLESVWKSEPWTVPPMADPHAAETLRALMHGYEARWPLEGETIGAEVPFTMPLRNPLTGRASPLWEVSGTIDALARIDGQVWVVEHKTAGEDIGPGTAYWQKLRLDTQCSVYLEAATNMGLAPVGVLYDVIRKPGLRPYKATPPEDRKYTKAGALYASQRLTDETPEDWGARVVADIAENPERYYQRGQVVRLESEITEAAWDLWVTVHAIRSCQLGGTWPRNPDGCFRYSKACDFFGLCTGAESLESFKKREPDT